MKPRTLRALSRLALAALPLLLLARDTSPQPPAGHIERPVPESLLADERNTIEVFRRATPPVVFVASSRRAQGFRDLHVTRLPQGSGSGCL